MAHPDELGREDGRRRVVIEGVRPEIDAGRFPARRVIGEAVIVEADIFADGHEQLTCRVLYRHETESDWSIAPMSPLGNDRWRGRFEASASANIVTRSKPGSTVSAPGGAI